jgi:tripartite-type tricarboxylate transporter receptor subunit TctC
MARVKAQLFPYQGSGPALVDLIGGRYDYNFAGLQAAQPHVRSGKLRGLAVTTPQRVAAMPDVAAVAEAIPGYEVVGWYGIIGPAGMPAPLVERLHQELLRVLAQPDVHERIVNDGSEPVGNSPREFRDFMAADLAKWAKVVKESGAKFE